MLGTLFLNRYHIQSILGQGGMGVVYLAHDHLLDRDVAVKVLSKSTLAVESRVRLLREAQSAARLNHPNIVSIFDAGEADQTPFIIMEYVPGVSLHEQPPAHIPEILAVARQICAALQHAHSRGIIHRDLKPENVILTRGGQVKLLDFGLARSVASRMTAEGSIVGSVYYMAPELALSQEFDGRADLYALGVMLYELVVGELPFTAADPLAVISQHLHAPVVPPITRNDQVPPALDALIVRLMSKLPENRPVSAGEVEQALVRIAAGEVEVTGPAPAALDRMVRGRLVGREVELAGMVHAWDQAQTGAGGVLLLSGEAGVGKSRLASELAARVQVSGARVLSGECYPEGGAIYAPITQMVEAADCLQSLGDLAGLPHLLTLAPTLRERYPSAPVHHPAEPVVEQQHLYDAVVELCAALSHAAPLLLVLEDAHWADGETLALLRHLARRAARLPLRLLILITYREGEADQSAALDQTLYDFAREHLSTHIHLNSLTRTQTRDLLLTLLDETAVTPEFVDGVYRETEGNPFFTEEVCKALIEQGKLARAQGHWRLPRLDELEIPPSIKLAIQARVGKMPPPAQDSLRAAAIFGREFDYEALRAVSSLDEDSLLDALESAQRAQLVSEVRTIGRPRTPARTTFAFTHALIASTLREEMSTLRRQRLHQRAALALETLNPNRLDELASQIGWHFAEAGELKKASEYLLRAGDRARQVYAYDEAIHFYQQALVILKELKDVQAAARTAMRLGLLQHSTFHFPAARQAFQEGFELWKAAETAHAALPLPAGQTLRLGWRDPLTLDPGMAYEAISVPVVDQLFVGLLTQTSDLEVAPELAQSWEVLEDGRKYIFHLRGDARWSDGEPVTAGDVEFAWKRVLNPATESRNAILLMDLRGAHAFRRGETGEAGVGVRALDALTLEVELEQPVGYFLHLLTYSATYPVPRHAVQAGGPAWTSPDRLVNSGPFCLEEWTPDRRIVLRRNPGYTGTVSGNLQQVELFLDPDLNQFANRIKAYDAGALDVCGVSDCSEDSQRAVQTHPGEYVSLPVASLRFLVLDVCHPPLDDPRVRRAVVQAIDRETLAEVEMRGFASAALGGLVPPGFSGHNADIGLPYAPDQARCLLSEAGYPNGHGFPVLEFWSPPLDNPRLLSFIQDQLMENLGIEIRPEVMDNRTFYERLKYGPPHIFLNGWLADYPDPDSFLRMCVRYESCWKHPEYDDLVENACRNTDQAERLRIYRQAEQILMREVPLIPLLYNRMHLLVKPWVRRFLITLNQYYSFKDVLIEPHN